MTGKEKRKSSPSSASSEESHDAEGGGEENTTPSSDVVLTKYNMAAEIVNTVLKELLAEAKDGAEIGALCDKGDKRIAELTSAVYKKEKKVKKGSAMPTCISVDHVACHYSPLRSEPSVVLKDGQVVKFDLGAHVDGYIALVTHTIVVGASKENKITDKKARAVLAAWNAMEVALRMLRPEKGFKNSDITEAISAVATAYGCVPMENMLSRQLERNKINGTKQIIQNPSAGEGEPKSKPIDKCTFENYEVYGIDVLISTSAEGKPKTGVIRTTVFKRTDDFVYNLKLKASKMVFNEVQQKFGTMPFSLRNLEDEVKAKVATGECEKHGLMQAYPVYCEREGEFVAHFKSTAIVMPNGILKITGLPLDLDTIECDVKLDDPKISALLKESLKPKAKKGKGAKKGEDGKAEETPAAAALPVAGKEDGAKAGAKKPIPVTDSKKGGAEEGEKKKAPSKTKVAAK